MSAYVVDRKHVGYLVFAADHRAIVRWHGLFTWRHNETCYKLNRNPGPGQMGLCEAAQMLWDENVRSVQARYPEDPFNLPGPIGGFPYDFGNQFRLSWDHIDPVQVLSACNCYEYQSCEHPGWFDSNAKAFIDALRHMAIGAVEGYDDAVWGAPEPSRGL